MRTWFSDKSRVILILIVTSLFCSGSFAIAGKGPKIKFNEDKKDFGKIKQGKVLKHVFKFTNEGDETLTIKTVRTSCGCAAALVSKKEIAPGEEGQIKVTLNTSGEGGKVSKYIQVESNDPSNRYKQLTVKAEVELPPQPKIELDRYSVDLGLFLEDEDIKARTKIKNTGELELSVNCTHKNASFSSGGEKVTFPLRIASGKEKEVEIRISPRNKQGVVREYILIRSNDPRRKSISFYLSGYIVTKKQLKELFSRYKDIRD
ncbi:MAG: DUF1573 domain-containing protein [Candidatus Aminicenantaceae bacterium]